MPRYEKGTAGKLIIQDYDVVSSFDDTPILYILSKREAAMLLAITQFMHWRTRWQNISDWDEIEQLVSETEFNLMNPITCAMLRDCLEPMFTDLKNDIIGQLQGGTPTDFPPNEPLPTEERERDLVEGTNPTCNLDIIWSQALQVTQYAVDLVTDILERAEAATNSGEFLEVVTSLPLLDEAGVDAIAGYANLLQEGIANEFAAQVTTAYVNDAACELFCIAQYDCAISLDDIYTMYYNRVVDEFGSPSEAVNTIFDLLGYLVGQPIDTTTIADVLLLLVWGGGVLANQFMGDIGTMPLETLLVLAVNDANNDWEILCTDCAFTFDVSGTQDLPGVDTGFDVTDTVNYDVFAAGVWNGGAGGDVNANGLATIAGATFILPGTNEYRLLWRVGTSGAWQPAATAIQITANATGRLYMVMNDVTGAFGDNSGSLHVTIRESV